MKIGLSRVGFWLIISWLFLCLSNSLLAQDSTTLFNAINAKIALGKYDDAMVILEKFESDQNLSKELERKVFYKKVVLFELKKDRRSTLEILQKAVEKYPTDFDYLSYAGYTLINSGEYEYAQKCLHKALLYASKRSDSMDVYYSLTTGYIHQGKSDSAIRICKIIQSIDSNDIGSLANEALAYSVAGQPQKAISIMQIYLQKDTSNSWIGYNNLALYYLEAKNFQQAKVNFEEALARDSACAFCYSNLGFCYHSLGDYQTAIKLYNTSIKLDPSNSWVYKNKGITYLSLNMKAEACEYLHLSKDLGYQTFYGNEVEELLEKHCDD